MNRHSAVVLAELASDLGISCRILSLNDTAGHHELRVGKLSAAFEGFGRNKIRFVSASIREARSAVITCIGHPSLAPLAIPLKMLKPSSSCWVHVYGTDAWRRLPYPARRGLRLATGIISISRYTSERASEAQSLENAAFHLLPCALDPEIGRMDGGTESDTAERVPSHRLLTVARLASNERYKGVDDVIRALAIIATHFPSICYDVVGDGDDRPRLEALATSLGVRDRVHFAGWVTEAQLATHYRDCDVFVMPSRCEGFGIVFLEAMKFAKPVVAGRHGGSPEVVEEGESGFLVENGAIGELTTCLCRLLGDNELRTRMGRAGRDRVLSLFTFAHFRRRLREILLSDTSLELPPEGAMR